MRPTDKNNPSTWKRYRNGLCDNCSATCCKMPVEVKLADLIRLDLALEDDEPRKLAKQLMKDGVVTRYREASKIFTLAHRPDGSCCYLGDDARCTVYEKRPDTCRNFPQISSRPGFCPSIPKD